MTNMFKKAVDSKVKTPKSKKTEDLVFVEGLDELAAIKAVMKTLETMHDEADRKVKNFMQEHFVATGVATKTKPANFKAVENKATGSLQLRKRTSRATLTDDEVNLLEKHGIHYDVVEDVTETFVINPEYANDEKLLERVSKALEGVKGIPENFIQHQAGVSRRTVSDTGLDQIFTKNKTVADQLFPIVATLATRLNYGTGDITEAMEALMELVSVDGDAE